VVGLGLCLAACKADVPKLSDALGHLDAVCTGPYADQVVDVYPSSLASPSAVLGAPDNVSAMLSANDVITVGFIGLGGIPDGSGPDIRVHATLDSGASATVRVAGTDMQFVFAGNLTPTSNDIDIQVAMLNEANYVRIIDVTGAISIDAVEAIHAMCP
jgi:hypothetical protein